MLTDAPRIIDEANLSLAWGRALLFVLEQSSHNLVPLVISIRDITDNVPQETASIRKALDGNLKLHDKCSCDVTAFTIFPQRLWAQRTFPDRQAFYAMYLECVLPRLKARDHKNSHGTYFERMISYRGSKKKDDDYLPEAKNQLEHIIAIWHRDKANGRRPRHSALQIACFDPVKDHTGGALLGFPCLQQVSFSYDEEGNLAVNAYYPTQYIFDRAYGNYLGLSHLGRFMACEIGLKLTRINCFIGQPSLGNDISKHDLLNLAAVIRGELAQEPVHSEPPACPETSVIL